ncbi:MAG TPA: hypothetical protein VFX60_13675 [Micromonospora sp.]|nr:hypothetical protein [Micromonospora sp.]
MAGVLIRMKLILLVRSFTGTKAATVGTGALLGLAGALGLLWLVSRDGVAAGDVLALGLTSWALGWLGGPLAGGGDAAIRREHFALLPIPTRRLVVGLLGAALVGVGPAVTLVAFAALVWYAAGLGPAAALVAVPAVLLLLILLAAVTNMLIGLLGAVVNSRLGAVLSALPWAALIGFSSQGWALFGVRVDRRLLAEGLPDGVATTLRALPPGWPLAAVEAADRGDWPVVAVALAGLAVLAATALAAWAWLLDRPATSPVIRLRLRRPGGHGVAATGAIAAVVGKELRTWSRDLVRLHYLAFAVVYGLVFVLLPLASGLAHFLPLGGVIIAVMIAACSAHLHSSDGTALWLTLMLPGSERADVRGRQVAWLLTVAPVAVLLTVVGVLVTGHGWAWPWTTALLPAVLGGGAGLIVLVSVYAPIRMPDPHRRGSNPGEDGGALSGLIWLMLGLMALAAAPALAVTVMGARAGSVGLLWAGTPVGLATGALLFWGLGHLAHRRLAGRGPELLQQIGTP